MKKETRKEIKEMREVGIFFTEKQLDNLPTVRITKAILQNFKNVEYGEITFNCGREFVHYNTKSDILGIYGQNGSGKTAFINALHILKRLLSGFPIDDICADCVTIGKNHAQLTFDLELQYPDNKNTIRNVTYDFRIANREITKEEIREKYKHVPDNVTLPDKENIPYVFNEKIYLSEKKEGKVTLRKQSIIDTSPKEYPNLPFGPNSKLEDLAGGRIKDWAFLEVSKKNSQTESRSFIFRRETLSIFEEHNKKCLYFQILNELKLYAIGYLYVLSTKSSGLIRLNWALPIYYTFGIIDFPSDKATPIPREEFEKVNDLIKNISLVIEKLVPGLTIGIKKFSETLTKDGKVADNVMLVAYRNQKELPIRTESDGVRRTISVISLLIAAFNQQSTTVAIDEFDAGIYEYLLGEILQIMEEYGKGQFIFTSHNLRPLEVINKKFICFTTTNPKNRYFRLKNVAATNNLRDTYFREILLGEQKEELYNPTQRFKIIAALKKASGGVE